MVGEESNSMLQLIEGGFLAQTILVVSIWGSIVFLALQKAQIPDGLLDAGFVIVGFYFRSAVEQRKTIKSNRER